MLIEEFPEFVKQVGEKNYDAFTIVDEKDLEERMGDILLPPNGSDILVNAL